MSKFPPKAALVSNLRTTFSSKEKKKHINSQRAGYVIFGMNEKYTRVLQMTTGKLFAEKEDKFSGLRGLSNGDTHKSEIVYIGRSSVMKLNEILESITI